MKVILDTNALQKISVFQSVSSVNVIDCLENDDTMYFVVKAEGQKVYSARNMGNIRKMENMFRKRVRVYEFSSDPKIFAKRIVPEASDVEVENGVAKIKVKNCFKPKVIGKDKKNLIVIQSLFKRFFDIEDVKII
jgi:NusA-like KH domain protein